MIAMETNDLRSILKEEYPKNSIRKLTKLQELKMQLSYAKTRVVELEHRIKQHKKRYPKRRRVK